MIKILIHKINTKIDKHKTLPPPTYLMPSPIKKVVIPTSFVIPSIIRLSEN